MPGRTGARALDRPGLGRSEVGLDLGDSFLIDGRGSEVSARAAKGRWAHEELGSGDTGTLACGSGFGEADLRTEDERGGDGVTHREGGGLER